MLEIKNMSAYYDKTKILTDISFKGQPSQLISLVGPSGTGKSTLLKVIAGLHLETEGDIILNQNNINHLRPENREIVYLSQEPSLFPHLNVTQNIGFGLMIRKTHKKIIKDKVQSLIKTLGLEGLENRKPWQLSGGQKQRVAIGRALAIEPKVLLLDEPFSSLDLALRKSLGQLIRDICNTFKIIIVLVTHDPNEALSLSDQLLLIDEGHILQSGSPETLYRRPINERAATMLGPWHTFNSNFYRPDDVSLINDQNGDEIIEVSKKDLQVIYTLKGLNNTYSILTTDILPLKVGQRVTVVWRYNDSTWQFEDNQPSIPSKRENA